MFFYLSLLGVVYVSAVLLSVMPVVVDCRYIQQDDGTVEERTTAFKGTESFSGSADQCFTDGSDYVESR